jgi:hypothetical protein
LDKPVKLILSDPVMNNKLIKIVVAFSISIYDRIRGHVSRLGHRMATARHRIATRQGMATQ